MGKNLRIGFVGLGKMGNPMSIRLMEAGYHLIIYDIIKKKTKQLADRGAEIADSAEDVAIKSNIILLSIPGDPQLIDACLGEQGILKGAKSGSILIDMSTVTPIASSKVAAFANQKGVKYLRAPVSGSTTFAAKGQLSIFVSGDKKTYDQCLHIFNVLGKSVTYVGCEEEARYIKLLINMMVATTSQMVAEALTFGEHAGIDWEKLINVIGESIIASPLIGYKIKPLLNRDFTPAFTLKHMGKDLDYALVTGKKIGVTMPITSLVRQFIAAAEATGKGNKDFFSLLLLMEEISGIKRDKDMK